MPREATISYDQVAATADAIKAEGGRPNSRNIRERLGQGSMGTIHKLLTQWQTGQARHIDATLTLPPPLQRSILDFMSQELASARATLEAELVEAQMAASDLATENERQASHLEALQNAIDELQDDASTVKGQLAQMEKDLAEARDESGRERQEAEKARTELAKAQLQLEGVPRLEAELDRRSGELADLRQQLQQAQAAIAAAEQESAVRQAKLDASQARAEDLDARRASAEQQAKELGRELSAATLATQAGQARLEAAAREVDDLRKAADAARADAKRSGELAAELKGQLAQYQEATADGAKPAPKGKKTTNQSEG